MIRVQYKSGFLSFFYFYHIKLNIFVFWTIGWTKKDISIYQLRLWEIFYYSTLKRTHICRCCSFQQLPLSVTEDPYFTDSTFNLSFFMFMLSGYWGCFPICLSGDHLTCSALFCLCNTDYLNYFCLSINSETQAVCYCSCHGFISLCSHMVFLSNNKDL